jgi:hypothetical protein
MAEPVALVRDPHKACTVFNRADNVPTNVVYRFVVGEDMQPTPFKPAPAREELNDSFAQELLLKGIFPETGEEVLNRLAELTGRDDNLDEHRFFLVGEGSQIPAEAGDVVRALRFLVACGRDSTPDSTGPGPDILLSTFDPTRAGIELMAWDHKTGGFNFYRTFGSRDTAWVFTGNSRHALGEPTRGAGPFENHRSGALLMKELRAPWIHWHSIDAPVGVDVLEPDDPLRQHSWFTTATGDRLGAVTCEREAARPSIDRWARARFDAIAERGELTETDQTFAQILDTPTVNITSSLQHGDKSVDAPDTPVELPLSFFVDRDAFGSDRGGLAILESEPTLSVSREIYDHTLVEFDVHIDDGAGFSRPGDTHFAFAVPERAYEDHRTVVEARRIGLITDRLAACLLMIDFANPIFSPRRAALRKHVPARANLSDGAAFSDEMANTIVLAASGDNPEAEFAELWQAGDDWKAVSARKLAGFLEALEGAVSTSDGFRDVYRVAISRRKRMVDEMPIAEFGLLFPVSTVEAGQVVMRADATVTLLPPPH